MMTNKLHSALVSFFLSLSILLHLVEIHLHNAFLAQARYLGSNVEVDINFDNAFLVQARYLSSNVEVKIFCRPPTPIHRSVCFYVLRFMRFEGTRAF